MKGFRSITNFRGGRAAGLARLYYTLVDAGDIEALLGLFAEDAIYARPGYHPLVGLSEIARFYRKDRVILRGHHKLAEVLASGGHVAVRGEFSGVVRSGESVLVGFADFFDCTERQTQFATRHTYFFTPSV